MWVKYVILALIGLGGGISVAGGLFALLIALGILSRFAYLTKTAVHLWIYEMAIAAGGIFGTTWYLFGWRIPAGLWGLVIYGFFGGTFVGAWTMALTEIIDTIPIFMRRIYLKKGVVFLVWILAVGHTLGAVLHSLLWG